MAEESIYNLIPYIPEPPAKSAMYRSKHDAKGAPSYTTFPKKEAAPGTRDGAAAMAYAGRSGAIGRDVGPDIDPKRFMKAHSAKRDKLPPVNVFERSASGAGPAKPSVPKRDDKPVMGLMSEKNFVHANSVDAVHTAPRHKAPKPIDLPTQRKDFAQTPAYLERIKSQVDYEKTLLAESRTREAEHHASLKAQYVREVPEEEKERLITNLRQRWEEKHRQYHALPFAQDTAMQIARKEAIERELKEIETALAKLSKKVVVVYADNQGAGVSQWAKSQAERDAQQTAGRMVKEAVAAGSHRA